MRLLQYLTSRGERACAVATSATTIRPITGASHLYELALAAVRAGQPLAALLRDRLGAPEDYQPLVDEGRVLTPVDHPDSAHCLVSGTGLTHRGSARARNGMHGGSEAAAEPATDSMRMFALGVEGGRPAPGQVGAQPEWFYKGDGSILAAPGQPLTSPAFAEDASDEAELCGIYLIGPDGRPHRLGYALGNELSDHVTERHNYLYLAHSKLRPCAIGPELRTGPLPAHVSGHVRIRRGDALAFEAPFETGEAAMVHSLENLEHHHFKYPAFRRPGDLHIHFFGADRLSFGDGFRTRPGDVFEIEAEGFGRPLVNPLAVAARESAALVSVAAL